MEIKIIFFLKSCAKIERTATVVPLAANNRPCGHHAQAHRRKRHQHRHGQGSTTIYERCGREAQEQGRDSMCLCREASVQAKMRGTGDEQTHNARSGAKVSGTPEFYMPNFLWNLPFIFFETQNIDCETRALFAFKRRVAVRTKATSLDGCVAL